MADPQYKGRYSVPVIWDKERRTIVSNESAEILRWLPTAFTSHEKTINLYPEAQRKQIDDISSWMQRDLNAGVYKAGFAPNQSIYDKNVPAVFTALNELEIIISKNGGPYVLGKELTELDVRAYSTIVRFDTVYVQHFKCNLGTIRHDYPVINNWLKHLYHAVPGFKESTDFKHIKENVRQRLKADQREVVDLIMCHSTRRAISISTLSASHQWAQYRTLKRGCNPSSPSSLERSDFRLADTAVENWHPVQLVVCVD